jgi:hypothetical protein
MHKAHFKCTAKTFFYIASTLPPRILKCQEQAKSCFQSKIFSSCTKYNPLPAGGGGDSLKGAQAWDFRLRFFASKVPIWSPLIHNLKQFQYKFEIAEIFD